MGREEWKMHEFRPVVEAIARITTSTKGIATCWARIPTMIHTKVMTTSFVENLHLWQARVIYVCKCMFKNILICTRSGIQRLGCFMKST